MLTIQTLNEPSSDWDDFVHAQPDSALGHAAVWPQVFREAYGLRAYCIEARNQDRQLAGVLSMVSFRSLRGSRLAVSLPFLDRSGILSCSDHAERAILDAALDVARQDRFSALELRQTRPLEVCPRPPDAPRVNLVLALEANEEEQWGKLRSKVRNMTRKAARDGLRIVDNEPASLLEAFYGPFCVNMRDLGSPVHSKRFFSCIASAFGDRLRFVVSADGDRPVGGLIAIHYGGTVSLPWASTLASERKRRPNNQIYWEAMRWAVERGADLLDFGRSPRSGGTHAFKLGWGAEEQELAWTHFNQDGELGEVDSTDSSRALQLLSQLWTRLPLRVTTTVGPRVRRFLSN